MTTTPRAARIPPRPPPYEPEIAKAIENRAFGALSPQNLRLALAHQPRAAAAFQSLAHVLLFRSSLDERMREIAIIRNGALHRSEYEWGMHVSIYAGKCGLTPDHIDDLTTGTIRDPLWSPHERAVIRAVDELYAHSTLSDATWAALSSLWSHAEMIEFILSVGFYKMAACFLNAAQVPLEEGQARFDGRTTQAEVPA